MFLSCFYHVTLHVHVFFNRLDGDEQECLRECLSGRSLCIDSEYNVLWSFDASSFEICCYNPVAAIL